MQLWKATHAVLGGNKTLTQVSAATGAGTLCRPRSDL